MEITELLEKINIKDYVSQYVDLEYSNGEYWGISPFTDPPEKTPSFALSEEKQRFFDFSSGNRGDVVEFVQLYHHCGTHQAIQKLQRYAGLTDEEIRMDSLHLLSTQIAKKFGTRQVVTKKSSGVILPRDCMNNYVFDEDKMKIWVEEGIPLETMKHFQVSYDGFSNRLVFPIKDIQGNIINISGRTLDPNYKENKRRKYTYFNSFGTLNTIYGISDNIDYIKKERSVILFEGAKSVMKAYSWGIKNVGAILTSHLSELQLQLLIKLGVRTVFALDSDVDIRQDKNIMKLVPYTGVEWVRNVNNLLEPKDSPVDKGESVFRELYQKRYKFR